VATEIGIIKTLIGSAVATATDGSQRTLQAGDRVYQDEVISTGAAGAVEVEFADGSVMTLGRSSQAILDLDVYNPQDVAQAPEGVDSDVEALQQALLDGVDPSQVADATAAGAGTAGGNEGAEFVQVIHEAPEVTPESGFDTTGITVEFDDEREEEGFDDTPTAGITTVLLDEDDIYDFRNGGSEEDHEALKAAFDDIKGDFESAEDLTAHPHKFNGPGLNDEQEGDDLPPDAKVFITNILNADFGNDGPGDIVFNAEVTQPAGLTSGGEDIQYWVSDDGHSLVAYIEFEHERGRPSRGPQGEDGGQEPHAHIIFTAEITDAATGEFQVMLLGPVDHPDGTTEDNLFVNLGFTISDFDGDTAAGVLRLDIDDDSPVIPTYGEDQGEDGPGPRGEDQGEDLTADEDDIYGRGNDDYASGDDGSNSYQWLPLNFGADGPAADDPVALSPEGIVDQYGNALTSNGVELQYTWDADSDTLIGYTDDVTSPVLTILVEEVYQDGAGVYIDLFDNLDHPINSTEDNLEFNIGYTVTDFDGDSVISTFAVDIDDDMPTIAPQRGSVDEEGIDGGNAGDSYNTEVVTGGVLLIPELEKGDLSSALSGEAKDTIRTFVENGGNLVINATSGSNDESLINSIFGFTISGGSGGTPYAQTGDAAGTAFASGPASLSYENGTYQWSASSLPAEAKVMYGSGDGAAVVVIPVGSGQITFLAYDWYDAAPVGSQDGGWLEILDIAVTQDGSSPADVAVFDNGSFVDTEDGYSGAESENIQATLNGQGHNVTTFTGITAADFSAALQVTLGDLAGEELTAQGNLGISWGADDRDVDGTDAANPEYDRSVNFDEQSAPEGLTSNGVAIVYSVSEDGLTLTATAGEGETVVFTVVISDEGAGTYDFTLLGNLDHPEGATTGEDASPGTEDDINLSFDFTATDSDGDAVGSHFTITVDDDAPVIGNGEDSPAPEDSTVDEEGLATAATQDDSYDGDVAGIALTAGGDLNISWGSDDNNSGTANRSVAFDAAQPGLSGLTSNGEDVVFSLSNDGTVLTAIADGVTVFTVSLSDLESGSYDFSLLDNLDHPTADTEDDINLTFNFTATDSDGDTAGSSFTITVDDDAPVIGEALSENDGNSILLGAKDGSADLGDWGVTPGALTGAVTMNGVTANIAFQDNDSNANSKLRIYNNNADHIGGGSLADNDGQGINNGETLTISFDQLMQQAEIGVDGLGNHFLPESSQQAHATWIAYKNGVEVGSGEIDNPEGQNEGPAGLLEVFTVSIPGGFDSIEFGNSSNNAGSNYEVRYIQAQTLNIVDEEGLQPEGNLGDSYSDNGDVAGAALTTGADLNIVWGADDNNAGDSNRSVTFDDVQSGLAGLESNGVPITFDLSDDDTVLTAKAGDATVFTVSLSDLESGSFDFSLLDNLDHPEAKTEDDINLTFAFTATDSDGDTVNGSFNVTVDDDGPTVDSNAKVKLDDDALEGGNAGGPKDNADAVNVEGTLSHSYGADGEGTVLLSDSGAPAGFVYSLNVAGTVLTVSQEGVDVLQVSLADTTSGDYTVTQLAAIAHADDAANKENNIEFRVNYQVTDGDGDTKNGNIKINVDDDTPTVDSNAKVKLDDDALEGGNAGGPKDNADAVNVEGTLSHSYGADGEGTVLLSDSGAPAGFVYSLNVAGTVLTVSQEGVDVLQVSLADTTSGDYTVTQLAAIAHADDAANKENNIEFRVNYQVTDGDGDTKNGNIKINVDDDTPVIVLGESSDSDSEFTVVNHDEVSSAGYHNSYGYYIKGDGGIPTTGVVLEDDVHLQHGGFTDPITVTGYSEEEIGFFIIPNGDGNNGSSLEDGEPVTFKFVDNTGMVVPVGTAGAQWQAFADDGATPLTGSGSHVLFDVDGLNNLNKDGQDHVQDNDLIGNQNWEDLQIPNGDGDYNDVNVNVDWTEVTVTGDVVDATSYGADGPGSIDFSIGDDAITIGGTLTSNGEDISFEAVDRFLSDGVTEGSDGVNDTIVGSAGDEEILTIQGILDGDYDVSVLGPIDDDNGDATVDIAANVTVTDGDGDSTSAILNIHVNVDTSAVLDVPQDNVF